MSRSTTLATLTAAFLASTALVAPSAFAEAPTLESGHANWNIKGSFLSYIQKPFAAATITASDGAEKVLDASKLVDFALPVNAKESKLTATGEGVIDLDGAISINAHHGAMDIQLSDFKVVIEGAKGFLQADYVRKGAMPGAETTTLTGDDKRIVEFDVQQPLKANKNNQFAATFTPTKLTEDGSAIFDKQYKAGESLADSKVSLALKFKDASTQPEGSSLGTGAIVGIVLAAIAALGGLAFAASQPGFQAMLGKLV
ncbi:HtaA domain-containing protein [Corynebacterium pseudogenitalium]|uniref:HtaA domain-containing protein n=1 Tax=Corynebacterium pseudogenitalium TaxID=38303 RepID=UPI003BA1E660